MFVRKEEQEQMEVLLRDWREQRGNLVPVFVRLHEILGKDGETVFSFKARPGVSYSLRAAYRSASDTSDIGDRSRRAGKFDPWRPPRGGWILFRYF
ncbi:MAG: hypothetical protein JRJ16_13815 [Deltaproteobacteria bacterium]|nr:hypothetical protein [Deltaproteobacteria bacterium]